MSISALHAATWRHWSTLNRWSSSCSPRSAAPLAQECGYGPAGDADKLSSETGGVV
jgi:hypothetical protein